MSVEGKDTCRDEAAALDNAALDNAALDKHVRTIANEAHCASRILASASLETRNAALAAMAGALRAHIEDILAANEADVLAARAAQVKESLVDRLFLDESRVEEMACALEALVNLADPLGEAKEKRTLENGIELSRVSVPFGVVAVVYEARPNVTADAAGICLKSGNAVVLRGGSLAARSCGTIAHILASSLTRVGLPAACIGFIDSTDRRATDVLMSLRGVVDLLVPRGGASLIQHCIENARVPVIETGTGNCHVYVHETANLAQARDIVINAKCRRYGVCNAAETLLVDESIAHAFLPALFDDLAARGVVLHCDKTAFNIATLCAQAIEEEGHALVYMPATDEDWATEYLAPELAVKCVSGVQEAIEHINTFGTRHSEAIVVDANVAAGASASERFCADVDAAAVYVNASTAFTDGGQFGLGAEIGISTQKLHVRGPFALQGLTTYKYVLCGSGQIRA